MSTRVSVWHPPVLLLLVTALLATIVAEAVRRPMVIVDSSPYAYIVRHDRPRWEGQVRRLRKPRGLRGTTSESTG